MHIKSRKSHHWPGKLFNMVLNSSKSTFDSMSKFSSLRICGLSLTKFNIAWIVFRESCSPAEKVKRSGQWYYMFFTIFVNSEQHTNKATVYICLINVVQTLTDVHQNSKPSVWSNGKYGHIQPSTSMARKKGNSEVSNPAVPPMYTWDWLQR